MIDEYKSFEEIAYYNSLDRKFGVIHGNIQVVVDTSAFRVMGPHFFQSPHDWYTPVVTSSNACEIARNLDREEFAKHEDVKEKRALFHTLKRVYPPTVNIDQENIYNAARLAYHEIPTRNARNKNNSLKEGDLGRADNDLLLYVLNRGRNNRNTIVLSQDGGLIATFAALKNMPRTAKLTSRSELYSIHPEIKKKYHFVA